MSILHYVVSLFHYMVCKLYYDDDFSWTFLAVKYITSVPGKPSCNTDYANVCLNIIRRNRAHIKGWKAIYKINR